MVQKALPIAEALYPGYSLLFLFDNATSHSVYADNALRASNMNKGSGGKQAWLRNGFYHIGGVRFEQPMSYQDPHGTWIQKGIQRVLEERRLWPEQGLNLECPKQKCFNCQVMADCRTCIKRQRCDSCKEPKQHSSAHCSKTRLCDACAMKAMSCRCIPKQLCATCISKRGKCGTCEEMPPKCTTNSE